MALELSINTQLASNMKFFLSLCFALFIVRVSDCTFVPRRCLCPATEPTIREEMERLIVFPKTPGCDEHTVLVIPKGDSDPLCLNPNAPMGKQLIRCWNRARRLGRNVDLCLKRRRRSGGPRQWSRQRSRGQRRNSSSFTSS